MDNFSFHAKDNYPPGVVRYTKYFGEQYDARKRLHALCVNLYISRDLLLYTIAEASLKRLLLSHDVELSEGEIAQVLISAAEAAYVARQIEHIDSFEIDAYGRIIYDCSSNMHQEIRALAAFVSDWAEKNV